MWVSAAGPTAPVGLVEGAVLEAVGWRYRLQRRPGPLADTWLLEQFGAAGWFECNGFVLVRQYPIGFGVGGHYVGVYPCSLFVAGLFAQCFTGVGHRRLGGATWRTMTPVGVGVEMDVGSARFGVLLAGMFGFTVDEDELAGFGSHW